MFSRKSIYIILIMLAFIISVSAVSAGDDISQDKNFTDIQTQINEADENATITLEGTYLSQGSEIKINKSITITSNGGATLNANAKSAVFKITNADVTIENLTIINSKSKFSPAISTTGNLKLINTVLKDNTVNLPWDHSNQEEFDLKPYSAGAIIANKNLEIINSKFLNNYVTRIAYDYEIYEYYTVSWGGSIKANRITIRGSHVENLVECSGQLLVSNSSFAKSQISSQNKATVENSNFTKCFNPFYCEGDLNIDNCLFTKNAGVLILCWQDTFKLVINNTRFIDNSAKIYGSHAEEEETCIKSCSDVYVYNSKFINNAGRGVYVMDSTANVENSIFEGQKDAAIYAYNLVCENSKFVKNYSHDGAVYVEKSLVMKNCSFKENLECAVISQSKASIDGVTYLGLTTFNNALKKFNIITITATKSLTTTYNSGRKIAVKMIYCESKNPVGWGDLILKITRGKKTITDFGYTNSKGIGFYDVSKLAVGTYKITIIGNFGCKTISTVKITIANAIAKAPKVKFKYKKSRYFKVAVKAYKKPFKNVKIKVKVKTAKRYKTYYLRTNFRGIAYLNTKNLKIGKHRVIISSGNPNYRLSAKSLITIRR